MTAPALHFSGVSHRYGDGPAVIEGMDLIIPGGVYGVVGNNGVGKSTWLKLAAGLMPPAQGKITVAGVPSREDEVRHLTALLPESLHLEGRLTAREFLHFAAHIRGVENGESAVSELLERLCIDDRADRLLRGLSFGSQRKVGLAAAFLGEPKVLLLDEPGNGLDVAAILVVEAMIRERRDAGTCVVLSSHDMAFVARNCERLLVMLGPGVVREDTPQNLLQETGQDDLHHAFSHLVLAHQKELAATMAAATVATL